MSPRPSQREEGSLVQAFAAAAQALETDGEVSPVIRTRFGYHIMVLHKQWAAQAHSPSQLRDHYRAEIFNDRARRTQKQLLDGLAKRVSPEKERAALTRMAEWGGEK